MRKNLIIFVTAFLQLWLLAGSPKGISPKAEASPYEKHLEASKKFKTGVLKNTGTLTSYKKTGRLVVVKTLGKGYRIQKLEYSRAVLIPKARQMLMDIARNFRKNNHGSTLTFTSLTRTLEDQRKLRKVNENAAHGLSTHNYGNAFDVSYVRFNDRLKRNERLERELEKELKQYQNVGKIYYIKERQQNCFHVTVR